MPPRNTGTLSMGDLLLRRDISAVKLGLDTIEKTLANDLAIHNRLTTDMVSVFADVSGDRRRRYGVSTTITFAKADEFTRAHTQKAVTSDIVEFPLDGFQAAIGWTAAFLKNKSAADLAMTQVAAEAGHVISIRTELQRAIFGSTNYTFVDYRTDEIALGIKRFLNADGADIPLGPNGETFDGTTHTHYLYSDGITDVAAAALVDTVLEHHQNGSPVIFINRADQSAWEALDDFKPYTDVRLTLPIEDATPFTRLDPFKTDDKPIGLYKAAVVWLKPWALSNYAVCMDLGPQAPKPLVCRVNDGSVVNGVATVQLQVVAENVMSPLQAKFMECEFGFGVWTRTNGAILYFGTGAVAYVVPTIVVAG